MPALHGHRLGLRLPLLLPRVRLRDRTARCRRIRPATARRPCPRPRGPAEPEEIRQARGHRVVYRARGLGVDRVDGVLEDEAGGGGEGVGGGG